MRAQQAPRDRLVLYVPWYRAKDAARQAEIDEALRRNRDAGADDVVVLVEAKDRDAVPGGALRVETTPARQTFDDVYTLAAKEPGTIAVWINADSYFAPGALDAIRARDMNGQFICITRWNGKILEGSAWGCQDAWALKSDAVPVGEDTDLVFGTPGIDHVANGRMSERGHTLHNPCYEVRVQHLHASPKRDYPPTIYGKTLYVAPEENGASKVYTKPPKNLPKILPRLVQVQDAAGRWQVQVRQ